MTEESKKKQHSLSLGQRIKVWDALKPVLTPVGDAWAYIDDLDDEKFAEQFTEFKITKGNVIGVRQEMFGPLVRPFGKAAINGETERRLQRLERQVERLTALAKMSNPNFKGMDDE